MASKSLLALMPHTVDVLAPSGTNVHGEATYTTVSAGLNARVVDKVVNVRSDKTGQEQVSNRQVFVAGDYDEMDTEHRLHLYGFTPAEPPIIAVTRVPTRSGQHHMKVFL